MAVIAIDFDNTIAWLTPVVENGRNVKKLLPGAKEAITAFREAGHKVIIHSCNSPSHIKQVLDDNDVRYDSIWGESKLERAKPLCDLYVDDRGFHFTDWAKDTDAILERMKGYDNRKW